ncbi:MAG: oxidoreductase [Candidatus Eisenbacteria bacterium]|nr:oxidoreductase [Candidatus Latescibacterota bacterium]MBD3301038.1 oxidoreductase [Candidatus Eisenbacteria bacterium]
MDTAPISRKSLFVPEAARILDVEPLTAREKLFRVSLNDRPLGHRPCQFVEVSIAGIGEAPISVSSSPASSEIFDLCVRDVGTLTQAMHRLEPGDRIGIRGPYGNGFPVEKIIGKDLLFVCGGLGLAPLRSLILHCIENRASFRRLTVLYGAKRPSERLYREELAAWAKDERLDLRETVDVPEEGWTGNVGVITTLFRAVEVDPLETVAVIVGPPVMYKFAVLELLQRGIMESRIYMSLERRMRCGLGKCGHCQMNGIYVCQEGPVFCYSDVKKVKEAL